MYCFYQILCAIIWVKANVLKRIYALFSIPCLRMLKEVQYDRVVDLSHRTLWRVVAGRAQSVNDRWRIRCGSHRVSLKGAYLGTVSVSLLVFLHVRFHTPSMQFFLRMAVFGKRFSSPHPARLGLHYPSPNLVLSYNPTLIFPTTEPCFPHNQTHFVFWKSNCSFWSLWSGDLLMPFWSVFIY